MASVMLFMIMPSRHEHKEEGGQYCNHEEEAKLDNSPDYEEEVDKQGDGYHCNEEARQVDGHNYEKKLSRSTQL